MAQKSNFIVRGGLDTSQITKGLTKTQAQLKGFQSKVSSSLKAVGAAFAAIGIGTLVKDSISAAMSVESSMNQISRIMGSNSTKFNNWVKTQSKAYGMAREEAYKYGATYGNLISTFSSGTEDTQQKTTDLLKASAVVASATGRTMEDTMERIRSGLLGNTEAIEDLGINVNVAMLQSTKAFQQFADGKKWNQLSFQQQQQIRLMAILEQANIKYGNSLAGTTATRQMQFLATLKNIRLNLGQAFLPVYNAVLPALTAMGTALEKVTAGFASFMQGIFGKSITSSAKATTTAVESATAATDNLSGSTAGVGDAASGAAKKIKKSLAGFDQLNQLADNSDTGSGKKGGGSGGAGGAESKIETPDTKIKDSISAWDGAAEKLEPLRKALGKLEQAFKPFAKNVGKGLKWFYDEVLVPTANITITEIVPEFLETLASALTVLNTVMDKFQSSGAGKPLGNFFSTLNKLNLRGIAEWFDKIGDALDNLNEWIKKPTWGGFKDTIVGIYEAFFKSPFSPTQSLLVRAIEAITGFNLDKWYENNIKPWLSKDRWKKLFDDIESWYGDFKKSFKDIIVNLKAKVVTKWNDIKQSWENLTNNIKDKIASFKAKIPTKWSDLSASWSNLINNIKDKTADFKGKIASKWSDFREQWKSLTDNFKDKIVDFKVKLSTTVGQVRNFVNDLVDAINSKVIAKLDFNIKAPAWLGGGSFGWKAPRIPRMAKGGIVDSATLAVVGEAGKEAVMPLENNTGWITDLAGKVSDRMNFKGNMLTEQGMYNVMEKLFKKYMNISLQFGDEVVARHANRGNELIQRREGYRG